MMYIIKQYNGTTSIPIMNVDAMSTTPDTRRSLFEPVNTQTRFQQVVEQLLATIAEGKFEVGSCLPPERELAQQLGVARTTLRQALAALEIVDILEIKPYSGNYIKTTVFPRDLGTKVAILAADEDNPNFVLEARRIVETQVAALAARRATEADIQELRESLATMQRQAENLESIERTDRQFHLALAQATHNPVLIYMVGSLNELWFSCGQWDRIKERVFTHPQNRQRYVKQHALILEAVAQRDGKAAQRLMREHIDDVTQTIFAP